MTDNGSITLPPLRASDDDLRQFAAALRAFPVPFKLSARGWAYQLEDENLISKGEFDRLEAILDRCIKKGLLPVDFIAAEEGRKFSGVETPDTKTPVEFMKDFLEMVLVCDDYYTPDWWHGEKYYIQMIVEKIDLKSLFEPVCNEYHIPIATSKGWSSRLQRAEYAKRFKHAENLGLKCILLYFGDFDPDGLRISDAIRDNLRDITNIVWGDGTAGYDPVNLDIVRFGLDYDFIIDNQLLWVNNLKTGSKKDLASPRHPNHRLPYLQNYLRQYGVRKCEANAVIKGEERRRKTLELCRGVIEGYMGKDVKARFAAKRQNVHSEAEDMREKTGLRGAVANALEAIEDEEA